MAGVEQGRDPDTGAVTALIEHALNLAEREPADAHMLLTKAIVAACQVFARDDDGRALAHMDAMFEHTIDMLERTREIVRSQGSRPGRH